MLVVIPVLVLLLQGKEAHLGGQVGGVEEVQAVRDQARGPGQLHHLVEEALETRWPPGAGGSGRGWCGPKAAPQVGQFGEGIFAHFF